MHQESRQIPIPRHQQKQKRPPIGRPFFLLTKDGYASSSSSSKVKASASRTRSSMALTGTAIPRSFSAASLPEPRSYQLPTSGAAWLPLVPTASSSGAVSEPYTSIRPPRVHCPLQPCLTIPQNRSFDSLQEATTGTETLQ